MFDLVLRGGSVIDGTGGPVVSADIGITDGRLTVIGSADAEARETKDVSGLLIAPGFVDPHTHYDAQLHWDPYATPSSWHGVTSVIGGNCGFTLAPLRSQDADFTRRMMAQVEGMPLAALEEGLGWGWESFGEFLGALDGRIAVNAGFLVGHCALRRYVMGADASQRSSTPEELLELEDLLSRSLQQGGLGFSTSLSSTHNDADGRPVPSRLAGEDEVLALCSVTGQHEGTCLEAIVEGCLGEFSEAEIELLAAMSARAGRSLNWNVLAGRGGIAGSTSTSTVASCARTWWPSSCIEHAGVLGKQHEFLDLLCAVAASGMERDSGRTSGAEDAESDGSQRAGADACQSTGFGNAFPACRV